MGTGRYVASEDDVTGGPVSAIANPQSVPGILYAGGLGRTATNLWDYTSSARPIIAALGEQFPIGTFDLGGTEVWGNDTAIGRVGSARTWVQGATSPCRAKAGKVFLVAGSMGFLAAANYAVANPANVAAIAAIVPLVDLTAFHAANRDGYAGSVNTAYGGTYVAGTHAATHSPSAYAASLNIPIKLWYAVDDDLTLASEVTAFAAAAPNCTAVSMAGGHTSPTLPSTLNYDLIAFLQANTP